MTGLVLLLMVVLGVLFFMMGAGLYESRKRAMSWFMSTVGLCLLVPGLFGLFKLVVVW